MSGLVAGARREEVRRRTTCLVVALCGLARLGGASPAAAQQAALERHYLTGDWNGVRPAFSAHGFQPYLTYTGMLWSNLAGGRETGAEVNGYLDFGMDVDLAKLGAWDGLGLHLDFHWWQGGEPTSELIGGVLAMALSGVGGCLHLSHLQHLCSPGRRQRSPRGQGRPDRGGH